MHAQLEFAVIEEILDSQGLHGYLERFVDQTIQLGESIHEAYLELE